MTLTSLSPLPLSLSLSPNPFSWSPSPGLRHVQDWVQVQTQVLQDWCTLLLTSAIAVTVLICMWWLLQGFALCPYCYSHPPFREMKKGMGCNECTHPSCPNSLAMTGVSSCVECDSGTLVLDLMSAPKWRIVCNRSVTCVYIYTSVVIKPAASVVTVEPGHQGP